MARRRGDTTRYERNAARCAIGYRGTRRELCCRAIDVRRSREVRRMPKERKRRRQDKGRNGCQDKSGTTDRRSDEWLTGWLAW